MKTLRLMVSIGLLAGLATATMAQQRGHMPGMQMMQGMMPKEGDSQSTKDFKQAHMKMMESTPEPTGNADADFARMMIPHHQGAINMARVQLAHGKDDQLKALAEKIIKDQEKEIAELNDWLKKNTK